MEELTARQRQVLDYIVSFLGSNDYPPTLRQISGEMGTSGTVSTLRILEALERKGYISREAGASRGIQLKVPAPRAGVLKIPIVGAINAGRPDLPFEEIEGYCRFEEERAHGGTFFLRVRGDSMIEDAILDGDLVLVRPQATAQNGDIVVAMVDGEVTLKRYYFEDGHVRLQPANRNMEPILVTSSHDFVISGKVVKVLRDIEH
ncbi:transcriptional repressor LexA [Geomonas propionica]|uniref:LexA repressor n=1 Tax=Geomonas propionica TaxID=2798582 RepID=A0ABS0YRD0_9BACT|nr:transcriptional repressor LexA [Geomonas propionica]MBJ6800438.1 repressor LexA [Geomonas propionica]